MNMVAAVSREWGLGYKNKLLFTLGGDMRRFRALTRGGVLIMGRKTFESFPDGQALRGRVNVVLSRDVNFSPPDAVVVRDLEELWLLLIKYDPDRLYVIGGEEIYRLLLPHCTRVFLTMVDASPLADCAFPNLDENANWAIQSEAPPIEEGGLTFRYITYRRNQ